MTSPSFRTWRAAALGLALSLLACDAAETRVDPADLELRDLLGVAPATAVAWSPDQRAAARRVLDAARLGDAGEAQDDLRAQLGLGVARDERVARALAALDQERAADGEPALALVRISDEDGALQIRPRSMVPRSTTSRAPSIELRLAGWDAPGGCGGCDGLPARDRDLLASLASDAGHAAGAVVVVASPRLAVIAAYADAVEPGSPPRLLVNPVLLAALEPTASGPSASPTAAPAAAATTSGRPASAGNPYSFYGSIAECAYAQRLRCDSCAAGSECVPITDASDGATECAALAADDGRGFYLLCINLALAISGVEDCVADDAPGCSPVTDAASSLSRLAANAVFLEGACATGLDACLADLYGDPDHDFPPPGQPDAGTEPPPAPRDTSVSCGESNSNCELSPSCDVSGPSCDGTLSCDACRSDSSSQSGCDGTCDSCESSDESGGGDGSCVSCDSDDGDGGGSDGGSCGGDDSGGDGGDCGGDGGDCGGDCGSSGDCGGDCGGSDCGGSDCGNDSSCSVTPRRRTPASLALVLAVLWALLPVPVAAAARRRARRRGAEVSS